MVSLSPDPLPLTPLPGTLLSQDTEDKTSISEQTGEMEAYCEEKGLTITARYQEVGRGWSKRVCEKVNQVGLNLRSMR